MTKPSRSSKKPIALTQAQAYAVAAAAQVDPRTVKRVAAGLPTRQMVTDRVMSALKSLGILLALLVVGCGIQKPGASPEEAANVASTVSLVQMLAAGMTTSAGAAIASGRVTFFLPGTLTPVSVYADGAAATPIAPPLVLTAGGTGIAYTKVPTRMIVKDSTSTTTYFDGLVNIERAEQQYIQSTSVNGGTETTLQTLLDAIGTSLGGTAGLWKFKAAASGTERNVKDVINDLGISVKSFGATGAGAVDDRAQIQATIDYVESIGGGAVFVPPGIYLVASALTLPASGKVEIHGAAMAVTFIKNTGGATGVFTTADLTTSVFKDLTITHSSSSTGTAVVAAGAGSLLFDHVTIQGHLGVASATGGTVYSINSAFTATGAGTAVLASGLVSSASSYITSTGTAASITGAGRLAGDFFFAGTGVAVDVGANATLLASACLASGGTAGLRLATTTAGVLTSGCNWGSGGVVDNRTGSPVAYTFAANGNFTPLPLQTESIRVIGTAGGITITINAAATTGFGRKFSIMQINNTGGACTFVYNAQYKLQGAAAANPATGNMIISTFEYDPISAVYRETARSASMAI